MIFYIVIGAIYWLTMSRVVRGQVLSLRHEQFVEAARHLAQRMIKSGASVESRLEFGFRVATARKPDAAESAVLLGIYHSVFASYKQDLEAAAALVSIGESQRDESLDVAELAAWTVVGNAILNLDETVTKG